MNKILTPLFALALCMASAFGAGPPFAPILRNSVTTNSFPANAPSASDALIWNGVGQYWTNGAVSATSTNALSDLNGSSSNHQFIVIWTAAETSNTFGIQTAQGAGGGTNFFHFPITDATHSGQLSSNDWKTFMASQTGSFILSNLVTLGMTNVDSTQFAISGGKLVFIAGGVLTNTLLKGNTIAGTNGWVTFGDAVNFSFFTNNNVTYQNAQWIMNVSGLSALFQGGSYAELQNGSSILVGVNTISGVESTNIIKMGINSYILRDLTDTEPNRFRFDPGVAAVSSNVVVRRLELTNTLNAALSFNPNQFVGGSGPTNIKSGAFTTNVYLWMGANGDHGYVTWTNSLNDGRPALVDSNRTPIVTLRHTNDLIAPTVLHSKIYYGGGTEVGAPFSVPGHYWEDHHFLLPDYHNDVVVDPQYVGLTINFDDYIAWSFRQERFRVIDAIGNGGFGAGFEYNVASNDQFLVNLSLSDTNWNTRIYGKGMSILTPFIPGDSLLGLNSSKNLTNITIGTGLSLSGGTLSATGGGGSGSPGGTVATIQFNQSGAFDGTNYFIYDRTNSRVGLNMPGTRPTKDIEIGGVAPSIRVGGSSPSSTNEYASSGIFNFGSADFTIYPSFNLSMPVAWTFATNALVPNADITQDIGRSSTSRFRTNWSGTVDTTNVNQRGFRVITAQTPTVANGTNFIFNCTNGDYFVWGVSNLTASTPFNFVITNLQQSVRIDTWVTNGASVILQVEGGNTIPAAWYKDQVVVSPDTNGWSSIYVWKNSLGTNVMVETRGYALLPGSNMTFTTNYVNGTVTLASSGGGGGGGPFQTSQFDASGSITNVKKFANFTNILNWETIQLTGYQSNSVLSAGNSGTDTHLNGTNQFWTWTVTSNSVLVLTNLTPNVEYTLELTNSGAFSVTFKPIGAASWIDHPNSVPIVPTNTTTRYQFVNRGTWTNAWEKTANAQAVAGPGISFSTNVSAGTVSVRSGGSIFTTYTADTGSPKTNIIIDASLGGLFRVMLTNNMGLILTNGYDGQELTIEIYQDGTGNRTVTHVPNTAGQLTNNWNFGQDVTSPITLTTNQYHMDMLKLRFLDTSIATNTCRSNWLVIGTLHKFSQ